MVVAGPLLLLQQVVLLVRGVARGASPQVLAAELGFSYGPVLIQAQAVRLQPERPLPDVEVEADELFQNAGEKGTLRRRGNRRRGHETYENDRPLILGVVGRTSGQERLPMMYGTDKGTLQRFVHRFTRAEARVYPDAWRGYAERAQAHGVERRGHGEWAGAGDGRCM